MTTFIAALVAAAAISFLYSRLHAIQPVVLQHAEQVTRASGNATAALARLITIGADLLSALVGSAADRHRPHDTDIEPELEGEVLDW